LRRALLPALAVLAVVAVLAVEVLTSSSNGKRGEPAPALPSAVLQPPRTTLAELRGGPALINFWASWCDSCREEAPELERLYRSLPNGAHLVSVDYTDQEGPAQSFIKAYGLTFPVLSDPDGIFGAHYPFTGLPATVVIDARGRIVQTLRGPQTTKDLHRALNEAKRS
jgi:cytochrome c biogenesis protein CcmG, thiol:disulfide interchange protein DsbE